MCEKTKFRAGRVAGLAVSALSMLGMLNMWNMLSQAPAFAHHSEEVVSAMSPTEATLYERIGGFDAIAAVVDDFIGRMLADNSLQRFFVGHSTDSKGRIREQIIEQVCVATGGPCVYTGRDTRTAHTGLGITEADWDSSVAMFVATLDKFQVPQAEKDEILAIVGSLKPDIVGI